MTTPELLTVKDLKVYYRTPLAVVRAVDEVSFTVKKNEILGIVGESGCGKTTLALGLLKLVKPPCQIEGGDITFDGIDLLSQQGENMRRIRWSRLSYIPQSSMNALNPVMRIKDQIIDAIQAHENIAKKKAVAMAISLLDMVGLSSETSDMYPHELSGGMKQRVIIAIATALHPQLIIADEATTALDVILQRVVLDFLKDIVEKMGVSLINITHDIAVQAEIADRILVMYAGKVAEIAEIRSIFKEPLHPYTRGLIEATPILGSKRFLKDIPGIPPSLIDPPKGCRFQPRCPMAMEKCKYEEPSLRQIQHERLIACHLYGAD